MERSLEAKRSYDWLGSEGWRAALQKVRVDGERPFYSPGEELAPTIRGRLDADAPLDESDEDR
jgi:hypothetical protein